MEIYLHSNVAEQPQIIEVAEATTVHELLVGYEDHGIWIEDTDLLLTTAITLVEAGVHHRDHLHRNRCHTVEVDIMFKDVAWQQKFSPATRLETVLQHAIGALALDVPTAERDDLVLARSSDHGPLNSDTHLGSLHGDNCRVELILEPRKVFTITINGRRKRVERIALSFEEILALAFDPLPSGPNYVYTVSYLKGPQTNPQGTLSPGRSVHLKNGMIFNATCTDKS